MKNWCMKLLLVLAVLICTACGKGTEQQIVEQLELGQRYLEEENYEEAIVAFTKVIEIDEKNVNAYLGKAEAYFHLDESEENLKNTLEAYEKVVELDQTNLRGYLGMADIYIRTEKYEDAIKILEKGYEITGDQELEDKLEEMREGIIKDSTGRYYRKTAYDGENRLIGRQDFTYDTEGKKNGVTAYDKDGLETGHVDILYDENGNCIQDYGYSEFDQIWRIVLEYDLNGNMIKRQDFNLNGQPAGYYILEYNLNNLCTRRYEYRENGDMYGYEEFEYNESGYWVKRVGYSTDGVMEWYHIREYEGEKCIKYAGYGADGNLRWYTTYIYDESGKEIGMTEYDADGNVKEQIVYE